MVEFIRQNPATEAFQRAQEIAQRRITQEIADANNMQRLSEMTAGAPSRLRSLTADALSRETSAGVAQQTAPHQVAISAEQAAQAPIATQAARRAEGEAAATSSDRVAQTRNATRLGEVNVAKAEIDVFIEALTMAEQGDVVSAKRIAESIGDQVPDEVLSNRALVGQLKRLGEQAKANYPSSPRRQLKFLQDAVRSLMEHGAGRQRLTDPTYPMTVPGVAPADETMTGTRGKLQFEVIRDAALALGYDQQTAFNLASGQKPPSDIELQTLARQLVTMEMPSSDFRTTPEQRRARFEEIVADLRSTQGRAPAATTQQAPDPARFGGQPAATPTMAGSGSQADPFKATTQQEVDWFKRSAPPGSVIEIDGQLYTK